ncbi:response regulator transcription factor [uncultured Marinobacter sp.]|uniref:response regulator transcription factor n=1 Tax=uncultured Marinobacter sp. TaxID=187379 RepID=UPI002624FD48|nr:response regulator transcription factor [uncultured Marinobacter sp.]
MTARKPAISIIEDNSDLLDELIFFLQQRGYSVWGVSSAEQFWKKLHRSPADIVMVDLGLPGEDGFSVVDYLKDIGKMGVIIATARGHQQDKLRGLNLGADLYLVKPVNFVELATAIDGLWRRMQQESEPASTAQTVREASGEWQLDASRQRLITPNGDDLALSTQEYSLVSTLARSAGEVFTKETLLDLMFCYEEQSDIHRIDVILSRLRKKAKQENINLPLRSIFGKGLVFVGNVEERVMG